MKKVTKTRTLKASLSKQRCKHSDSGNLQSAIPPSSIDYASEWSANFDGNVSREQISYEKGPRTIIKECTHTTSRMYNVSPASGWRSEDPSNSVRFRQKTFTSMNPLGGSWTMASYQQQFFAIPFREPEQLPLKALPWDTAIVDFLDNAWGIMPRTTTFLQNIAEFSQLKNLIPSLLKGARGFCSLLKQRRHRTRTIRDIAGSHLAYEFGMRPLISDVQEFFSLGSRIRKKREFIDRMISNSFTSAGTFLRSSCSVKAEKSVALTPYIDNATRHNSIIDGEAKLRSSLIGSICGYVHVVPYDSTSRNVRLWISALGLNNPIAIAWEVIPFSFVVDWFLSIDKTLDSMKLPRDLGSPFKGVTISNMYHWCKSVNAVEISGKTPRREDYECSYTPGSCCKENVSFTRTRGWPASTLPSGNSRFSVRQGLLSLSLAAQRIL